MLKIFARIAKVDMEGFQGREFHPRPELEGCFVRVLGIEQLPEMDDDNGGPTAGMFAHPAVQFFECVLIDGNGDDIEDGEVGLVEHELESKDGILVTFTECYEDPGKAKCARCGQTLDAHTRPEGDEALHCPTAISTYFTSRK